MAFRMQSLRKSASGICSFAKASNGVADAENAQALTVPSLRSGHIRSSLTLFPLLLPMNLVTFLYASLDTKHRPMDSLAWHENVPNESQCTKL